MGVNHPKLSGTMAVCTVWLNPGNVSPARNQRQIVHRACSQVDILHIDIGHLAVVPGHLQAGVPQQTLQAERIPPVSEEAYRSSMP